MFLKSDLIFRGANLSLRAYGFQTGPTFSGGFRAVPICSAGKLTLAQFEKHFQDEEAVGLWGLPFIFGANEHPRVTRLPSPDLEISSSATHDFDPRVVDC